MTERPPMDDEPVMDEPASFAQVPGRLQRSLGRLTRRFPLPGEAVDQVDPNAVRELIALVNQSASNANIIQLGKQLPQRTLDLIFPALASSELEANGLTPRTIDRLLLILRERACRSLYNKGWVIWQRRYPNPQLTRALAVLCGILEIKQASKSSSPMNKPAGQTSQLINPNAPRQPAGWTPLITDLVELSGHAICRKLIARLEHQPLSLNQFFKNYAVETDCSFYRSVLGEAFSTGTAAMFSEQISHLEDIFSSADVDAKAKIMRHFLTLNPLADEIRQQAHVVFYRAVGAPGSPYAVWTLLNDRERRTFRSWVNRARIGSHCLNHPEKADFYLRYADQLRRAEPWDSETLLLYFNDFVIADDARYPDQALFYPGSVPSPHPGGLADPDRTLSPGSPAIAHRRIEEALRQGEISGIIQLLFDPEGLKQSGVLIDFALQSRAQQGFFAPLRNRNRQLT